jgi:hypothetical protein
MMDAFERSVVRHLTERVALYRALVAAIKGLSSESLNAGQTDTKFGFWPWNNTPECQKGTAAYCASHFLWHYRLWRRRLK